jgi:hypothetical protein
MELTTVSTFESQSEVAKIHLSMLEKYLKLLLT